MKDKDSNQQYQINVEIWQNMMTRLDQISTAEELVGFVSFYGAYFSLNPTDYLYAKKLEDKIRDMQFDKENANNTGNGRTLHVATQIYATGGHTKVIENWIRYQNAAQHDILLTEQYRPYDIDTPAETNVIKISTKSKIQEKIQVINNIYSKYEKIILHIHPYDIVPLLAINKRQLHKYYFYNHADHIFNIGTSLTGTTLDMSTMGSQFSLNFRGAKKSKIIPVPLPMQINKNETSDIKIPDSAFVILTAGSQYKYMPTDDINMFKLAENICNENADIHFVFVGPSPNLKTALHIKNDRVQLLGIQTFQALLAYYNRCDIYLDSMPISGGLAILNAALCKKPILTTGNGLNIFDSVKPFEVSPNELKQWVLDLKCDPTYRYNQAMAAYQLAEMHIGEKWLTNFAHQASVKIQLAPNILEQYMQNLRAKFNKPRLPNNPYWLSFRDIVDLYKISRSFRLTVTVVLKQVVFRLFYPAVVRADELSKRIKAL